MQDKIKRKVKRMLAGRDPAHDFYHIMRVYKNAKLIGQREGTNMERLTPKLSIYYHPLSMISAVRFAIYKRRRKEKRKRRRTKSKHQKQQPSSKVI